MRNVGVSFKPKGSISDAAVSALGAISLIDLATKEPIGGISSLKAEYSVDGAIKLTVEIYPSAVVEWEEEFAG